MSDLTNIKTCLESYFEAVDSQKTENPIELKPALLALEEISNNIRPEWPGRLKHYLESRSYRKAYTELGGQRD
ncbi:MAG: hypothetical protein KTR33_12880 [Gammaproteobacteria bacterium]|nr:hypothetical protein [Gammaproteobacteria bacterium]